MRKKGKEKSKKIKEQAKGPAQENPTSHLDLTFHVKNLIITFSGDTENSLISLVNDTVFLCLGDCNLSWKMHVQSPLQQEKCKVKRL